MSVSEKSITSFPTKRISTSIKIYLGLAVALIALHVTLTALPVGYAVESQATLGSWPAVIVCVLLGIAGVWLSQKAGFPDVWDDQVPAGRRLLLPALLGAVSGTGLFVLMNLLIQLPGQIHVPFPTSILFYAYGAIQSEIPFRLFLIPLFVWLISSVLLKNRRQELVFWCVAIALSLLEPLTQVGGALQMGVLGDTPPALIGLMFATIYGVNLASAYLFRKAGFLAPLALRLSLYLVWHVIVGALVG